MIVNIAEIESVVTRYTPALVIASLPGDPELDLQLCRLLLRWISAPVMVISFLDDVDNRIAALDAGIADYLVSPVSPLIVAARVRNIIQRRPRNTPLQKDSHTLHKEVLKEDGNE
jgi:DNA-binding response OmpR family regulator